MVTATIVVRSTLARSNYNSSSNKGLDEFMIMIIIVAFVMIISMVICIISYQKYENRKLMINSANKNNKNVNNNKVNNVQKKKQKYDNNITYNDIVQSKMESSMISPVTSSTGESHIEMGLQLTDNLSNSGKEGCIYSTEGHDHETNLNNDNNNNNMNNDNHFHDNQVKNIKAQLLATNIGNGIVAENVVIDDIIQHVDTSQ